MEAASVGLTRVQWDECRRLAPLVPPTNVDSTQGALGIYRGQTVDFILAHAQVDERGKPGVHYVIITADALRQVAGRVKLLYNVMADALPQSPPKELSPLHWIAPSPPTAAAQVDDLLDFLLLVHDDFKVIDDLLAAVIQGIPLVVINAPGDLDTQLGFIQGLLTLLPVPARFGVTFATHVRRYEALPVQIAFLTTAVVPEGALCYDWATGTLNGQMPGEDPYSRFIMQQLRLDPTVAVQQMVALTRTTGWRLSRQETLAQALGWAARRVALDTAVAEGQPADSEMVAAVLREDPTLTPAMRVAYARHLLAFALGLDRPGVADILAGQAGAHHDVEQALLEMLGDAIRDGKAYLVYRMIAHWMAQPDGPAGSAWQTQAYMAVSSYLQMLAAARNTEAAVDLLTTVHQTRATLRMSEAAPELLEIALPLAKNSPELTGQLFLLAAEYLPAAPFQRLARMPDFTQQLPPDFQAGLKHFQPGPPLPTLQPGLVAQMAHGFGEEWSPVVLARLVEWVTALARPDLIDVATLEQLARLANSPWREQHTGVLKQVVQDYNQPDMLNQLADPGPRYLVEILLLLQEYRLVTLFLDLLSTARYRGDAQSDFAPWVSDVFARTSLDTPALLLALEALAAYDMKAVPLAMAYRGALLNKQFDPALEPIIMKLTAAIIAEGRLVPVVGYDVCLRLVQFHARRQDEQHAVALAAVITNSLGRRKDGLTVVGRLWTMLNWNKDLREAALELMRRYVRQVPVQYGRKIPAQVGPKLGSKVSDMLQATVVMTICTGGHGFDEFAAELAIAANLLTDMQAAYIHKPYPTMHRLRSDLDGMSGGLDRQERAQMVADFMAVGELIMDLGGRRGGGRNRAGQELKLIAGEETPRSAVDALLFIGGNLSGGTVIPPNIQREAMHHVLGGRSVNILLADLAVTRRLLLLLQTAFPANDALPIKREAFQAEIESLWKGLSLYNQRTIKPELSGDAQALAMLIGMMADAGEAKALTDSGLGRNLAAGKREPKSALEAVRLFAGYFD